MPEERTTSSTGGQKGVKLARFDLIPAFPLLRLAEHFGKGAKKYAEHQWRSGYEWSKSYSAIQRHLNAFWAGYDLDVCSNEPDNCLHREGETYDPDTCYNHTGSHHIDAVMWHSFVLREFIEFHPRHDDRYISDLKIDYNEVAYLRDPIGQIIDIVENDEGLRVTGRFFEDLFCRKANPNLESDPDQLPLFDLKDIS